MKELHLVVTYHWWEEIVFGDKDEEYREGTQYWFRRLYDFEFDIATKKLVVAKPKKYTHLVLHRAYTSTIARFPIENISLGYGNQQWGAPKDRKVIIIKISK